MAKAGTLRNKKWEIGNKNRQKRVGCCGDKVNTQEKNQERGTGFTQIAKDKLDQKRNENKGSSGVSRIRDGRRQRGSIKKNGRKGGGCTNIPWAGGKSTKNTGDENPTRQISPANHHEKQREGAIRKPREGEDNGRSYCQVGKKEAFGRKGKKKNKKPGEAKHFQANFPFPTKRPNGK